MRTPTVNLTTEMTAQEIHDKIVIIQHPYNADTDRRMVTGQLNLEYHMAITRTLIQAVNNPRDMIRKVHNEIHTRIMYELYEDQRQLLYKPLTELISLSPLADPAELYKARNDLLSAATFQQPTTRP